LTPSPSTPPASGPRSQPAALDAIVDQVRTLAAASDLFGAITRDSRGLNLEAPHAAAPASYRVNVENGTLWAALVTPDRYLSQSIEQDLVHTGDKMGDLLQDELIDVDHPAPYRPVVEHFRDAQKLFTFRSAIPATDLAGTPTECAQRVWLTLKAYQACFVNLGGMNEGAEGE